jgi:uncharacterized protein (DUF488 family)
MRRTLYTIGFEGADIAQFLGTLVACEIEQVLDIREVPVSRKPGFSKSSLQMALDAIGIRYCHLKALGDPKRGREAMRRGVIAQNPVDGMSQPSARRFPRRGRVQSLLMKRGFG